MPIERATAAEVATVTEVPVMTKAEAIDFARRHDVAVLEGRATVSKHWADGDLVEPEPYEVIHSEPNLFLTAGISLLWTLATGQAGTAWSQANARLAVGTSTTAAAAGQTALTAESTRVALDGTGGIVISGNAVTFKGTFGTGAANVAWQEVGVVNAASTGVFLNRLVQNFGTKTSSASWILQLTLSIS